MKTTGEKYVPYKAKYPFSYRKKLANKKLLECPDLVPVICEKGDRSDIKDDCCLVMITRRMTVTELLLTLRRKLGLESSSQAIFLFVNRSLVSSTMSMETLYSLYADADGFLYVAYLAQNVYG